MFAEAYSAMPLPSVTTIAGDEGLLVRVEIENCSITKSDPVNILDERQWKGFLFRLCCALYRENVEWAESWLSMKALTIRVICFVLIAACLRVMSILYW